MPESRKRKKAATGPRLADAAPRKKGPSPRWWAPLMLVMFGIGVLWLVVYYISEGDLPVGIGDLNLLVGFGFIIVGFMLATQWR